MMLTAYAFEKLIKPFGQFSFWLGTVLTAPDKQRPPAPKQQTFQPARPLFA